MVGAANGSISTPIIVNIRPVIGVTHRGIIGSVWPITHEAKINGRPNKEVMEWPIHIYPVVHIYKTCIVGINAKVVIVNIKSAKPG